MHIPFDLEIYFEAFIDVILILVYVNLFCNREKV